MWKKIVHSKYLGIFFIFLLITPMFFITVHADNDDINPDDQEALTEIYGNKWAEHKDEVGDGFEILHPVKSVCSTINWSIVKGIQKISSVGDNFFKVTEYKVGQLYPHFENDLLSGFVETLSAFELFMLATGVVVSIGEETIRYGNGQGNFGSLAMNIVKAVAYTLIFLLAACNIFQISNNLGETLAARFMGNNDAQFKAGLSVLTTMGILTKILGTAMTTPLFFLIAALGVFLLIRLIMFYAKKVPQMMAMLAKGAVMPFFIARGNNQTVTSYLQSLGMYYLQLVLQFVYLGFGIGLATGSPANGESAITNVFLGIMIILSINEVGGWLGGMASEDDFQKIVSLAHHANLGNRIQSAYSAFGGGSSSNTSSSGSVMGGGAQ